MLGRHSEALSCYDKCLAQQPTLLEALQNRANVLTKLGRYVEALASYDRAIELKPDYAEAYFGRGCVLLELKRDGEAVASLGRAATLGPNLDYVESAYFNAKMSVCDWTDFGRRRASLAAAVENATGHCPRSTCSPAYRVRPVNSVARGLMSPTTIRCIPSRFGTASATRMIASGLPMCRRTFATTQSRY